MMTTNIVLPKYTTRCDTFADYIQHLISRVYKILPLKEEGEKSLSVYVESFLRELVGCSELFPELSEDPMFVTLLATLTYLQNHDLEVHIVRQEVFKSISVVKKLEKKYRRRCEV